MQFPLDPSQRDQAERLWRCQQREVVDVRPSKELDPAHQQKSGIGSEQELNKFICILHEFFLAHLHVVLGKDRSTKVFLRYADNPFHSSLGPYVKLALKTVASKTPNQPTQKVVALWEGRRVVFLHHEEFIRELDYFMCQSKGTELTDPWRRVESYGAFLHHFPERALAAIGVSMRLAMISMAHSLSTQSNLQERFLDYSQLQVRFTHMTYKTNMMDIKTGSMGKLVTVKGSVVKARPKRLRIAIADFTCQKCGASQIHAFDKGRYSVPTKCVTVNCKSKSFSLEKKQALYHNVQEIRLQEAQEESTAHSGRTPRQMPVELCHDLVDSCRPGDTVMVACIVDVVNMAVAAGKTGKRAKENSTFTLVLLGHSITTLSETTSQNGRGRSSNGQQQFSQQQLQSITELCHADHKFFSMTERRAFPFDLLVRSICPSIVGHHEVKAGILLCLLGGTPPATSFTRAAASGEIRSNSHMLIVGDPGMGKSQMLLAASQLAARSVFVGGNTSSTTGLTVTLTKEEGGESGLEAGALVLADNGVCCLDEFDKMPTKAQDGLLEAMEQQSVSLSKAGCVASLPARCSVVAAANPKHGSYNMNKTVAENLSMSKPILSRFDLVFILRDKVDEDLDRLVSSNIMNLYRKPGGASNPAHHSITPPPMSYSQKEQKPTHPTIGGKDRIPIWERLAWVADIQKTALPADLVRDYIAYAREYCKPKLTVEASEVLREYFMQLRYPENGGRKKDTVPITTRQLEAMIRLSQARAKACLREFVIAGDALDVVELMRKSVDQVHSDEAGSLDPSRGGAGGMSNRKKKKAFEAMVKEKIGVGNECSEDSLRVFADQADVGISEFQPTLEDLREKGVLIKKSDGMYKVCA